MLDAAVLFLVFNRPGVTSKCFDAIRKARPARLYVAADGPRDGRGGEKERCEQVRAIATAVDWPCEVKTLFRSENLGCRRAVSSAISWFFESESEGIILEDDCLASPDWFRFAKEMLSRYRDDERIMCVSATHFHGAAHQPEHSYFFSRYNHCWGWASWRRAWAMYDADMTAWPELKKSDWLFGVGHGNWLFASYWREIFVRAYENQVDSWAYRWTFSCWAQSGLTVLPRSNLVQNIGFGGDATHTEASDPMADRTPLESMDFPLQHPERVLIDITADTWTDQYVFGITLRAWLSRKIRGWVRSVIR
jgi:hypothetical protein